MMESFLSAAWVPTWKNLSLSGPVSPILVKRVLDRPIVSWSALNSLIVAAFFADASFVLKSNRSAVKRRRILTPDRRSNLTPWWRARRIDPDGAEPHTAQRWRDQYPGVAALPRGSQARFLK